MPLTLAVGGLVSLDYAGEFKGATASAAAAVVTLVVDGTSQPGGVLAHTGLGGDATILKMLNKRFEAWLPAGAHTFNVRAAVANAGAMSFVNQSFEIWG